MFVICLLFVSFRSILFRQYLSIAKTVRSLMVILKSNLGEKLFGFFFHSFLQNKNQIFIELSLHKSVKVSVLFNSSVTKAFQDRIHSEIELWHI